ncbi:MAG: sulfatase, partial [Pedosphaera sp.]|nr:sulfatase [Pedosphaera sp.]
MNFLSSIDPSRSFCEVTRREMLQRSAVGFGGLALESMLGQTQRETGSWTHHPSAAKRVIFLFMHGGPSHVDTFDYKPLLARDHDKPLPFAKPRVQFAQTGHLMASPWSFRR